MYKIQNIFEWDGEGWFDLINMPDFPTKESAENWLNRNPTYKSHFHGKDNKDSWGSRIVEIGSAEDYIGLKR
ncbi:MAG: hypothetical protein WC677_07630 [Clostridia bacterium]|jgi:hypothetical protein